MSPDKAPRSSADWVRPLAWAGVVAFGFYAGAFALSFGLSSAGWTLAIGGALANVLPDAVLAVATLAVVRRVDAQQATDPLVRRHLPAAIACITTAVVVKTLLLWVLDTVVLKAPFNFSASICAWQIFLSTLIYVVVAATVHTSLISARFRAQQEQAVRAEALRARAEMTVLRSQLNPHFLFNTLHSVLGMVRRDPNLAEAALERLGDLMRYAMRVHRDGVDWTTLRQEWAFAQTYLDLEMIRLGDRLQIERRLADGALEATVPTFSLQPLVENAVRHGIAPRAAGGRIAIEARRDGPNVHVEVTNDCDLHTRAAVAAKIDEGGLGLRLLRERLDALYQGRASVTAGPVAGAYRVVLSLPITDGDAEAP